MTADPVDDRPTATLPAVPDDTLGIICTSPDAATAFAGLLHAAPHCVTDATAHGREVRVPWTGDHPYAWDLAALADAHGYADGEDLFSSLATAFGQAG